MGRDPSRGRSRRKAGMKPELGAEVVKPLALGATPLGPGGQGMNGAAREGRAHSQSPETGRKGAFRGPGHEARWPASTAIKEPTAARERLGVATNWSVLNKGRKGNQGIGARAPRKGRAEVRLCWLSLRRGAETGPRNLLIGT